MTRLKTDNIAGIVDGLQQYDRRLLEQTGRKLKGIACHAANIAEESITALQKGIRVGVVPLTCGQGVIDGFSKTLAGIARHLGFASFVTRTIDAAGMAEACQRKADILMMADDICFVSVDFRYRQVSDNAAMTARGFVAGLELMVGGLWGKSVLVIGCGQVGTVAAAALLERGARVSVHDVDASRTASLIRNAQGKILAEPELTSALMRYELLFDASYGTDLIGIEHVREKTTVAAPGMPCGVKDAAAEKLGPRLLHDPLQIGVACMLVNTLTVRMGHCAASEPEPAAG